MLQLDDLRKHVQRLDIQVKEAIALYETASPPIFDKSLVSSFENTYAAHALNVARNRLFQAGVTLILAAWEDKTTTLSIPALMVKLRTPGVINQIVESRRHEMLKIHRSQFSAEGPLSSRQVSYAIRRMARKDARIAEVEARSLYRKITVTFDNADACQIRESLFVQRNHFAHMLEITRAEIRAKSKGRTIPKSKWGDLNKTIEHTAAIVADLGLLIESTHYSFEDVREIWNSYSADFWKRVIRRRH